MKWLEKLFVILKKGKNNSITVFCTKIQVLKLDSSRNVGPNPKLKPPWKGPYVVLEVV